jgi:hypothetical protein
MKNCDIKIKYRADLDLKEQKQIMALPDNLSVGGSLYLGGSRRSRLAAIQDKFKVLGTPVGTIRENFFDILARYRSEVPGLLKAIREAGAAEWSITVMVPG